MNDTKKQRVELIDEYYKQLENIYTQHDESISDLATKVMENLIKPMCDVYGYSYIDTSFHKGEEQLDWCDLHEHEEGKALDELLLRDNSCADIFGENDVFLGDYEPEKKSDVDWEFKYKNLLKRVKDAGLEDES